MDTLEQLLMQLYEVINTAKKSMFSSTDAIVNRAEVLDLLDRIRAAYPEVVREAQYYVKENEAQRQKTIDYCASIVKEAETRRARLLDESDIIRQATEEAEVIHRETMELKGRVEYDVKCKVDEVLRDSEVTLRDALTLIRNNREELRNTPTAPEVANPVPPEVGAPAPAPTAYGNSNPNA